MKNNKKVKLQKKTPNTIVKFANGDWREQVEEIEQSEKKQEVLKQARDFKHKLQFWVFGEYKNSKRRKTLQATLAMMDMIIETVENE